MKVLLIILVFGVLTLIQAPALIKKKQWGELAAVFTLLAMGFMLSLLQTIGVKIPNPNDGIEFLIRQMPFSR